MFTDCAVALSTSPICSAMCMKRLLKSRCAPDRRSCSPRAAQLRRHPRAATPRRRARRARQPLLEHHRRVRLDDERRSREGALELSHGDERHLAPAAEPGAHRSAAAPRCAAGAGTQERARVHGGEARLGAQCLDHRRRAPRAANPKRAGARAWKRSRTSPRGAERHRQRHLAVPGAHLEQPGDPQPLRRGSERGELGARLRLEPLERAARCREPAP